MDRYNLVFNCTSSNSFLIENLIRSISKGNNKIKTCLVVVLQNGIDFDQMQYSNDYLDIVKFNLNTQIGLSRARNIGLKYLYENKIEFNHIMFPDDDTTFDEVFFNNYLAIVKQGNSYLIDVKCEGSNELYVTNDAIEDELVGIANYHYAMSVNMIIDEKILDRQLFFDEILGVGAKYGSAEDSDFFIRCVQKSGPFYYSKILYNNHPSPKNKYATLPFNNIIKRFRNYGNGVIYALCKHGLYYKAAVICFRAVGGVGYNLLRLRFKLASAYFVSFFYRSTLLLKLLFNKIDKSNQLG